MRSTLSIRPLVGVCALVALLAVTLSAANPLPEGNGALAADIAFLQKGLSKEPQKREVTTLKAVAMLVALNAQNNSAGKDAAKMAGVRDAALKVAEAVTKKDYAGAKNAAAALSAPKSGGEVKAMQLETMHNFDLAELMSSFRKGTVGGLNLEADIKAQGKAVTNVAAAGVIGGRVALIGDYTLLMPPSEVNDATKKKQWADWSKEMTTISTDIAKEAAKGDKADKAALVKQFKALELNCTACHNVFRN